jgi:hypothetical protein
VQIQAWTSHQNLKSETQAFLEVFPPVLSLRISIIKKQALQAYDLYLRMITCGIFMFILILSGMA